MSTDILTPEIRQFLSRHIDSVATLEVLLLFRKQKDKEWTLNEIEIELKSSSRAIEIPVRKLLKEGFIKMGSSHYRFHYAAAPSARENLIEKLEKLYPQYRMRVIDYIYNPQHSAAHKLAQGFKFKGDNDDA